MPIAPARLAGREAGTPVAPLRLFNTLGRRLQLFEPLHPRTARIYSCGPTVYAYQHIGNLRAYVFADTLRRVLAGTILCARFA